MGHPPLPLHRPRPRAPRHREARFRVRDRARARAPLKTSAMKSARARVTPRIAAPSTKRWSGASHAMCHERPTSRIMYPKSHSTPAQLTYSANVDDGCGSDVDGCSSDAPRRSHRCSALAAPYAPRLPAWHRASTERYREWCVMFGWGRMAWGNRAEGMRAWGLRMLV